MNNRPSFDPRYAHGQQAGGATEQRSSASGVPAMFLPNYSGDGRGTSQASSVEAELPMWSGDGRHSVANPLMPVFQADGYGHRTTRPSAAVREDAGRIQPPQVLPSSGDGRGSLELSEELSMTVNAAKPKAEKAGRKRRAKRTQVKRTATSKSEVRAERSETWKLVSLVVVFLIWISTASTLLFLYMDRYLFP